MVMEGEREGVMEAVKSKRMEEEEGRDEQGRELNGQHTHTHTHTHT